MLLTIGGLGLAVLGVLALLTMFVVVPKDRRPSSATAWILTILLVPLVGLVAFFLIGSPRLPKARRDKQVDVDRLITQRTREHGIGLDRVPGPDWLDPVVRLNQSIGAMPMLKGNDARIWTGYEATIAAMTADVAAAQDFVHVEFYILSLDDTTAPFFDALDDAVRRGVTVRVLLDHVGSWRSPGYRRTLRRLDEAGVPYRLMLPVQPWFGRYQRPDLRNHRKIVVVDGRVGWIGSQNLVDRTYNRRANIRRGLRWQDLMVRVRGPVVQELDAVFATDWFSETDDLLDVETPDALPGGVGSASDAELLAEEAGPLSCQVVPSGPGFDYENNLRLFNALLYAARRRVSITSPYFVPDESLLYAVTAAALRGVDVELFVPQEGDQLLVHHAQRSYYEQLLRSGVRIHRYPAPYVLHAKHMTVDDDVAVVGSSNLDMRSFSLDLEATLLVHGRSFCDELRRVEDGYRAVSTELQLEDWVGRSRREVLLDNVSRLTSALQ
ncbi:cardiolipin synthase [Aquipuribacter nitratireducens]|uniref:Cardiolipin synthase n=1 Tax=Aquipuribacter nitratireducens TaxID=650104 RepID=A0ABW0GP14_9MICO